MKKNTRNATTNKMNYTLTISESKYPKGDNTFFVALYNNTTKRSVGSTGCRREFVNALIEKTDYEALKEAMTLLKLNGQYKECDDDDEHSHKLKISFKNLYDKRSITLTFGLAQQGIIADMYNAICDNVNFANEKRLDPSFKLIGHAPGCSFEHYKKVLSLVKKCGEQAAGTYAYCYEFIIWCQKEYNHNKDIYQVGIHDIADVHLDVLLNASNEETMKYKWCLNFLRTYSVM